jgi:hypothetical protein
MELLMVSQKRCSFSDAILSQNDLKANLNCDDTDLLKEKTEAVNQASLKIYESMNANNASSCDGNNGGDNNNAGGNSSSDGTFNGESKEV